MFTKGNNTSENSVNKLQKSSNARSTGLDAWKFIYKQRHTVKRTSCIVALNLMNYCLLHDHNTALSPTIIPVSSSIERTRKGLQSRKSDISKEIKKGINENEKRRRQLLGK